MLEEPVPDWVLDRLFELRAAPRKLRSVELVNPAFADWTPGDLVSAFAADPMARLDRYVVDGRSLQVDLHFCVRPGVALPLRDCARIAGERRSPEMRSPSTGKGTASGDDRRADDHDGR